MSQTNKTTNAILKFLFSAGIFAWRANVLPVPLLGGGFRPGGKAGTPDILGILTKTGRFLGIEIKSGRDRLRPEQIGFHKNAMDAGALILVVKDFEDFLTQWNDYLRISKTT